MDGVDAEDDDIRQLVVEDDSAGERIDKWLAAKIPEISRSKAQWLLEHGYIHLNHTPCADSATRLKTGDQLQAILPHAPVVDILPVALPLDIIHEDDHLLVINKAAGMPVHPAAGHYDDTLVNALLHYCPASLSAIGGEARPGIVHRLDKDTSGLMVVAKNDQAHRFLSNQLADRSLTRLYHALVWGVPLPLSGTIHAALARSPHNRQKMAVVEGGKPSTTHYRTLQKRPDGVASLVSCKLETGRTHQIRVHMSHKGHSLIGDETYGRQPQNFLQKLDDDARNHVKNFARQALHASELAFIHPATQTHHHFRAPWPKDMAELGGCLGLLEAE